MIEHHSHQDQEDLGSFFSMVACFFGDGKLMISNKFILATSLWILSLVSLGANQAQAFSYIFAGDANGLDRITHASNYTGAGGVINITIGIDITSLDDGVSNTADMAVSVQNVVNTWNSLNATTGNVIIDFTNIPVGEIDFESVLLHEMGHSLGLSHNNLGYDPPVTGVNTEYAYSTDGADNTFSFGAGVDGVIGTRDDVRGDDVNLNYFRADGSSDENNPFTIAGVVDSTTYSRDLADLPVGDLYSGVSSEDNAATFASVANNTEAVLNQGTSNNQIQRTLGHDDVAGILYANSGLDSIAGTADDYTMNLQFVGNVAAGGADIVIDFDNTETGFAVSKSSGSFLTSDDAVITSNNIFFNDSSDWFYNQVSNAAAVPEPSTFAAIGLIGCMIGRRRRRN